jgi:hypothetical protein
MLAAVEWLVWAGVPFLHGLAYLVVSMLVAVGIMRIVAEAGVYFLLIHTGPFHLARVTGLQWKMPAATIRAVAPILYLLRGIVFKGRRDYAAPDVLQTFKMQEEVHSSQTRFHLIVVAGLLVSIVVVTGIWIYLGYLKGADNASWWGYTYTPQGYLDRAQRAAASEPGVVDGIRVTEGPGWNALFYVMGFGWVFLSLLMRRRLFWWLHPIGFVLLCNQYTIQIWFSFFIGWVCKKVAVQYGGRYQFARVRPFFIGLIFGEVMACFMWAMLKQALSLERVYIPFTRWGV